MANNNFNVIILIIRDNGRMKSAVVVMVVAEEVAEAGWK